MALARRINKAKFDTLADNIKFEYIADGDDFVLQTEGDEDTGALKRANARLKDQLKTIEDKNDSLQVELEKINANPARKKGDIESLERSWAKEKDEAVSVVQAKLDKTQSFIRNTLLQQAAASLAEKISTAPAIMRTHIEKRLTVDMDGETPVVKVLDAEGKPSAMTADKLGEEFVANKDFSAIIRVTKASGGAGPSNAGGAVKSPAPGTPGDGDKPANLANASPSTLVERIEARKAEQQQAT
jgi:hypothetical protein